MSNLLFTSLAIGVVTYLVYNLFEGILRLVFIQEAISLGISVGTGAIVYALLVKLLKVEEIDMLINMVKKLKNHKTK